MTKPMKNKKGRAQTLHSLLDNDQTSQIMHKLHRKKKKVKKKNISMRIYEECFLCLGNPCEMRLHQLTVLRISCLLSQKMLGGIYIALSYLRVSNTW